MHKKAKENIALELLLRVSQKVSSSLELEKVSDMILEQARSFLGADYSALFLFDEASKHLFLIGAKGFKSDQLENLKVLGSWEEINRELVKKSRALIVNDTRRKANLPLGAFLAVPLKTESGIIGALIVSDHKKKKRRFGDADKKLLYTLANHVSIALLNATLHKDMKTLFLNTITSLVTAVDAKDPYTHGHSERVARYAVVIAEEMNLSGSFVENLRLSGILHDIGKIGIRDNILSKATRLNKKEVACIHGHPLIGSRIVSSVINSKGIIRGIEEHHEHFDGNGYPKGFKGKRISLEGRIIAVADAFDTLTTKRPYKRVFTAKEALLEIVRSGGTQFDRRVVKAFQRSFSKHPEMWKFK